MVQRSKRKSVDQPVELGLAENPIKSDNYSEVWVTSQVDAKVTIFGSVTGQKYVFARAGARVKVAVEDLDNILKKRLGGRACCGGAQDGNVMFVLQ